MDINTKQCKKCKEIKDLSQFHRRSNSLKSWCKQCCIDYSSQWTKSNMDKVRASRLKCKHNISLELYQTKLQNQNGLCAICNKASTRAANSGTIRSLCLDHCHITGNIRGLLCDSCNTAVGLLNDNIDVAVNLVNYLIKYRGNNGNNAE